MSLVVPGSTAKVVNSGPHGPHRRQLDCQCLQDFMAIAKCQSGHWWYWQAPVELWEFRNPPSSGGRQSLVVSQRHLTLVICRDPGQAIVGIGGAQLRFECNVLVM